MRGLVHRPLPVAGGEGGASIRRCVTPWGRTREFAEFPGGDEKLPGDRLAEAQQRVLDGRSRLFRRTQAIEEPRAGRHRGVAIRRQTPPRGLALAPPLLLDASGRPVCRCTKVRRSNSGATHRPERQRLLCRRLNIAPPLSRPPTAVITNSRPRSHRTFWCRRRAGHREGGAAAPARDVRAAPRGRAGLRSPVLAAAGSDLASMARSARYGPAGDSWRYSTVKAARMPRS